MNVSLLNFGYQVALKSPEYPFKLSCIIFKGKKVLSAAWNEVRCCSSVPSKYKRFPESLHAEAAALAKFKPGDLKGCSAFICRVNAGSKRTAEAKCCARCQQMMYDYGIKRVFCTTSFGTIDKYILKPIAQKITFEESTSHDYRELFLQKVEWVLKLLKRGWTSFDMEKKCYLQAEVQLASLTNCNGLNADDSFDSFALAA